MTNIESDLIEIWNKICSELGIADSFPYSDFGDLLDEIAFQEEKESQNTLEPWISLLEQAIQWLSALHYSLHSQDESPEQRRKLVPWALTGAACTQAVAIRKLCLSGLDAPARSVLRTLIETLNTCIVTIFSNEIRQQYSEAKDFDEAKQLWRSELSGRNMRQKLVEAFIAVNMDTELCDQMLKWQAQEIQTSSQTVHMSYIAAALAAMPLSSDATHHRSGIMGASSRFSIRTLSVACKAIWIFSKISLDLLLRPSKSGETPLHTLNMESDIDKLVFVGYLTLREHMRKYWNGNEDRTSTNTTTH